MKRENFESLLNKTWKENEIILKKSPIGCFKKIIGNVIVI
jgi:hypothetical protein